MSSTHEDAEGEGVGAALARTQALCEGGELAEAEAVLREALLDARDDPALLCRLAEVLEWQGRLREGALSLVRALALDPHHADANRRLGRLLVAAGWPEAALPLLSHVCSLEDASATDHSQHEAAVSSARARGHGIAEDATLGSDEVILVETDARLVPAEIHTDPGSDPGDATIVVDVRALDLGADAGATEITDALSDEMPTDTGEPTILTEGGASFVDSTPLKSGRPRVLTAEEPWPAAGGTPRQDLKAVFPSARSEGIGRLRLCVADVLDAITDGRLIEAPPATKPVSSGPAATARSSRHGPLAGGVRTARYGRATSVEGPAARGRVMRLGWRQAVAAVAIGALAGGLVAAGGHLRSGARAKQLEAAVTDLDRDDARGLGDAIARTDGLWGDAARAVRAYAHAALGVDHGGGTPHLEAARDAVSRLSSRGQRLAPALGARIRLWEASRLGLPGALTEAEAQAELGALDALAQAMDAVRKRHPERPLVHVLTGRLALLRGEEAAGVTHLFAALDRDPHHPPAHRALARWALARGDLVLAAEHLDVLMGLEGADPAAAVDRVLVHLALGEAVPEDLVELAAADGPAPFRARVARALLSLPDDDRDPALARAALQEVPNALPDDPEIFAEAGRRALAAGRPADAAEHLQRAVGARPDDRDLLLDLATARLLSGAPAQAAEILEGLPPAAADAATFAAWSRLAMARDQTGDGAGARSAADALVDAGVLEGDVRLIRARRALEAGDPATAVVDLESVRRALPGEAIPADLAAPAFRALGRVHHAAGREADALGAFRKAERHQAATAAALGTGADGAIGRLYLGRLAEEAGEPARARRLYEEALRQDPGLTAARAALDALAEADDDGP